MYDKNFNVLFKSMFLRKNGRIEKKIKPLIDQTFNNCSATTYFFLNRSPSNSKTGCTENEA